MDPSKRASVRTPAYGKEFSVTETEKSITSIATMSTQGDARLQEIKSYSTSLERLDTKQLQDQRYIVSAKKSDDMAKLALGGKVQRALDRRYSNQDAIYKPKAYSEKK